MPQLLSVIGRMVVAVLSLSLHGTDVELDEIQNHCTSHVFCVYLLSDI